MAQRTPPQCDCGEPATHIVGIMLGSGTMVPNMPLTHSRLYLCEACYELFLEVEGWDIWQRQVPSRTQNKGGVWGTDKWDGT